VDSIAITPKDTTLEVGSVFTFTAVAFDAADAVIDTTFEWSLSTDSIGTVVDSTGEFSADSLGEGYVFIEIGSLKDSAHVVVTEVEEVTNTVTIKKMKPNGTYHNKVDTIEEGEGEYKFSGFPSPLNFLNGGRLEFPDSSLKEDITIIIKLPVFTKINASDSVTGFDTTNTKGKVIASGVEFVVVAGNDTISPYYFQKPLIVSLPFKHGLLANMGITAENLEMTFYTDSTGIDTTGISGNSYEGSKNRVTALCEHFSTVVLAGEPEAVAVEDHVMDLLPDEFVLEQNYPNPFNPVTKIKYHVPVTSDAAIKIYNMLGQEVRTLVSKQHVAGSYEVLWDGKNNIGHSVTSGIYIYRLEAKDFVNTKRMILIR
ncbi:T9SS type A sorting domain-containing protein, partial [candidate division KSB1 bacterium]